MISINSTKNFFITFFRDHLATISSRTFDWIAGMFLHIATIPSYVAVMKGITDKLPNIDIVMFVWAALALMFVRSVIRHDVLNTVTIAGGFMLQAMFLALILFR